MESRHCFVLVLLTEQVTGFEKQLIILIEQATKILNNIGIKDSKC